MAADAISHVIQSLADALFVPWLVVLLFASGLFLTLRYRVVQVRRFGEALAAFVDGEDAARAASSARSRRS